MATQIEVLITAKDQASAVLNKVGTSAEKMSNKLDAAGKKFTAFGQTLDSSGRQLRIGLSSISQFTGGASSALGSLSGAAGQTADAIGDIAGAALSLGPIGVLAGLASVAFAAWAAAAGETKQRLDEVAKPFDDLLATIQKLDATSPLDNLAASVGKSTAELHKLIEASSVARAEITQWVELEKQVALAQEKQAVLTQAQAQTYGMLNETADKYGLTLQGFLETLKAAPTFVSGFITALQNGAGVTGDFAGALTKLEAEQRAAASAADAHALSIKLLADEAAEAAKAMAAVLLVGNLNAAAASRRFGEDYPDAFMRTTNAGKEMNRVQERGADVARFLNAQQQRLAKEGLAASEAAMRKAAAAAERLYGKLKGLVENALTPTAADPNMGASWDEARKRFEAFASGTSLDAYGEDFKKMFEGLGMSAQSAADAFKNFSLFADPENMKLIDWGPIVASVEQQLLSMAGKANVTAEAMRQVWANLSPTAKAALAEQGIENAGDAMQALVDPAGLAEEQVGKLGDAVRAIPTSVTTTFTAVTDSAKAAIDDLAEFLDKFINAYGTVTVSARGDFWAPAPPLPGEGTAGMGEYPPPPIIPSGNGGDVPGAPREIYNNRAQTNNMNIILPNVTTERDAHQIASALQRMSRNAMLRAAQGLV